MAKFARRILLVDADSVFREATAARLQKEDYEVLTATDGFAALIALRGSKPDLLVTELSLPRMSGFELLSIVRTRFPEICVIVVSAEFTAGTVPPQAISDAFLQKGSNIAFELFEVTRQLLEQAPVRGSRTKAGLVWVPRSRSGYLVLTCPECLRSFSVRQPLSEHQAPYEEECVHCGAKVPFELANLSPVEAHPLSRQERGRLAIERSHELMHKSQERLNRPKQREQE
jgi:CheY-like chemotaxis protein